MIQKSIVLFKIEETAKKFQLQTLKIFLVFSPLLVCHFLILFGASLTKQKEHFPSILTQGT